MFTRAFWKDAAERAVATAAQSALAVLGADGLLHLLDVDALGVVSVAGGGALLSLLKSLVASRFGDGTASLVAVDPPGRHATDR